MDSSAYIVGKVLWWSKKDKKGIILDPNGNEFYFDESVLNVRCRQGIIPETIVIFNKSEVISDTLCATNIKIPSSKQKIKLEKRYHQDVAQLSLFAF